MDQRIVLNDREARLRQLLLDASDYIGTLEGLNKPVVRFAGGWVRDKLLGLESKDIDVAIDSMTGIRFGKLMQRYAASTDAKTKYGDELEFFLAEIKANPDQSKHLETTTTNILGLDVDLVNLRKEEYADSSRNPTMEFGTPEEDALRRDATVNAMFYNLATCEIEDLTRHGLQDMKRKIIRTPLSPYQTFKDDPLRVLRCIRFASRLKYRIDPRAEEIMNDQRIRDALRLKIKRERIGAEVIKMLRGPDPHAALAFIDRLGLYNTIFTNPPSAEYDEIGMAEIGQWEAAYNQLLYIVQSGPNRFSQTSSTTIIHSVLLRNTEDEFKAWLLCAFIPRAKEAPLIPKLTSNKTADPPAAVVAREGIKADNKQRKLVSNAITHLHEIIAMKDDTIAQLTATDSPLKRKQEVSSREAQGMAIRRWGSDWRSSVMFALLHEIVEAPESGRSTQTLQGYASWLKNLQKLDLLDVYDLKPLVQGAQLFKALQAKGGPWVTVALDMVMRWQLQNPGAVDPQGAIDEVVRRKEELNLVGNIPASTRTQKVKR